ncbi:MAG: LCP family protein [Defluviitaleaceae bacterium]|nr:LCP family protein [Defluviitaleaceae bacterium]
MLNIFKNKKARFKFIKSLCITLVSVLAVSVGTLFLLRSLVRPPVLPVHADQPFFNPGHAMQNFLEERAFDVVEPHPDDALINTSPFDFIVEEGWVRKPDFYTILIFGYDGGLNTDTIMVAAFDAAERQAYIVSVPRDTQVDVSRNVKKINSAYPVGLRFGGGHDGGVDQLKRELQTIIGFRPDFYVSVEEDAFVRIIDAVDGVYVTVPFHMRYNDPTQNLRINIPAGHQRLDGKNALHFVRYRMGSDGSRSITDYQRMQHQQQLIESVMKEMMTPRMIPRIPELIRTYRDHVNTDLSLTELLWFGEQFILGEVTLHAYNYPTRTVLTTLSYEIPQAEEALEIINRTINPFTRELTRDNLQLAS